MYYSGLSFDFITPLSAQTSQSICLHLFSLSFVLVHLPLCQWACFQFVHSPLRLSLYKIMWKLGLPRLFRICIWGSVSSQRRSRFERATRSLATFICLHCSLALQRSASLRSLAPFTGSLTHFAHSLVGQLKFLNVCSGCKCVSKEQSVFTSSLETRP